MIGRRLGPYEITAQIGVGGMGEVYRATDTRLDRQVAIKVLPASFAGDAERLVRFEREAKLLAQLHHPNIASIFGLEESDAGGAIALVMELVEGPTLAERLAGGALPAAECLAIAHQIAEALEEAHEKGIVHRDLKPQNIKAPVEGKVKVLDFGLAKAMDPLSRSAAPTSSSQLAQSPTLTIGATQLGVVLGTAAYMAPEQAKGFAIDKRVDIWAFGVVLHEMLTGRQLFAGDSVTDTLAAVLMREIDWSALPPSTPLEVRRLLQRCLERNPKNRLHDIADARLVLDDVRTGRGIGIETPGAGSAAPGAPTAARARRRVAGLVAALALAVAAGGGYFAARSGFGGASRPTLGGPGEGGPPAAPRRFLQVTDTAGVETAPTLSPDGKDVVFVRVVNGRADLHLQRVGGRSPIALTADSDADDLQPAFSPDGEKIAFRSEREGGGIFLMDATGESVRRLSDFGFHPTWSPDGKEVAVSEGNFISPTDRGGSVQGLWALDVATGARREISRGGDLMQPSWSPHGHRIAFWGLRGTSGQRDLWTIAADGSEISDPGVPVTDDAALDWSPTWSPDGRFLYFSSNRGGTMNLWRIPIDERGGHPLGAPEPVTTPSLWSGNLSFSRDGKRVAYASLDWRSTLLRVEFDAARGRLIGQPVPVLKGTQPIRDHQLSPDGAWVAYSRTGTQEDILVARVDGSQSRRLTDDAFRDRGPAWSPDGTLLSFYSDRGGGYQVWSIRPDGSGLEQITHDDGSSANFSSWSPDGRRLAFSSIPGGANLADLSTAERPAPIERLPPLGDSLAFWPLSWSADGAKLAGIKVRGDGTVPGLTIFDLRRRQYEDLPSRGIGTWQTPVWLADSRRLIVRDGGGIWLLEPGRAPQPLVDVGGYSVGRSVGLTRDDRWLTYTETGTEGDIWLAEWE